MSALPPASFDPLDAIARLRRMQETVRTLIIDSRAAGGESGGGGGGGLSGVTRTTEADTIYAIDAVVEPAIEAMAEEWARQTPLVLISEGIEDENGVEGKKIFPAGTREEDALLRIIIDPIDGTRGLMYDKRPAWALAGVAPNRGPDTRLRDIEVAVMTELPTSKMGQGDVLWAIRGQRTCAVRVDLATGTEKAFNPRPSTADTINHGFASVSNFFPGTKVPAARLMEHLAARLIGPVDVTRATVFDDQYISTGGQWYELIAGRDRFNADLRPAFYRMQGQPEGLCCHPYDCACLLIAEEAGVILTDAAGHPLDGPLDVTTGLNWIGYANPTLREQIEPLVLAFLKE